MWKGFHSNLVKDKLHFIWINIYKSVTLYAFQISMEDLDIPEQESC